MVRHRGVTFLRDAALAATYVAAYLALDRLSYIESIANLAITPWNPPPGLSLFFLLRHGLAFAPALFVAAFLSDVVVRDAAPLAPLTIASAAVIAAGYTAVAAVLLRLNGNAKLRTVGAVNQLVGAAVLGPALVGAVYVAVNVASGALPPAIALHACMRFWIGDAVGILVTLPVLLEFVERRPSLRVRVDAEAVLQAVVVALTSWIVFGPAQIDEFKLFYVTFVPVIWIAMRRGIRGAILASLAVQIALIVSAERLTAEGVPLWELQLLVPALALTALYLGVSVTQHREAERLRAAQEVALNRIRRVAVAGEMTAAIAHEINQPLYALGNYARACVAMLDRQAPASALRETLQKINGEAQRAGEVVRRLRESYLHGAAQRERVALDELVERACAAVRARAAECQVQIEVSCAPDLPRVDVDRVQMELVVRNLLDNAIDALCERKLGQRRIRLQARAASQGTVSLEIADNGPGVPAVVAGQLFEPFTSTKVDGMGFGLAISRSMAEAHGGSLTLVGTGAGGTTFRLVLPAAHDHG